MQVAPFKQGSLAHSSISARTGEFNQRNSITRTLLGRVSSSLHDLFLESLDILITPPITSIGDLHPLQGSEHRSCWVTSTVMTSTENTTVYWLLYAILVAVHSHNRVVLYCANSKWRRHCNHHYSMRMNGCED